MSEELFRILGKKGRVNTLMFLFKNPNSSFTDIVENINIPNGSVQRSLEELTKKGFLEEKATMRENRVVKEYELTKQAKYVSAYMVEPLFEFWKETTENDLTRLQEEEIKKTVENSSKEDLKEGSE